MHQTRPCRGCGTHFHPTCKTNAYCNPKCRPTAKNQHRQYGEISPSTKGAAVELLVSAELMLTGWAVFRSLSPACFCDVVAVKGLATRFIEIRCGHYTMNGGVTYTPTMRPGATEFAVVTLSDRKVHFIPDGSRPGLYYPPRDAAEVRGEGP